MEVRKIDRQTNGHIEGETDNREGIPMYYPVYAGSWKTNLNTSDKFSKGKLRWLILTVKNGCLVVCKTLFSVKVWATSSFCIITAFFRILIAYRWFVAFSLQRITLPNVPFPSIFKNWKSSKLWNKTRCVCEPACPQLVHFRWQCESEMVNNVEVIWKCFTSGQSIPNINTVPCIDWKLHAW